MMIQTATGEWLNARHVSVYYITEQKLSIMARLHDGKTYEIISPEYEKVNQDLLDDVIRIIAALKLTNMIVSQHDLWKEINKIKR